MVVVEILVTIILVITIWWFIIYYHSERYLRDFPGPTPLPIIGNAHQIGVNPDVLGIFSKFNKKYGSTFKLLLGFIPPHLVTTDLKMVEYVLTSTTILDKAYSYRYMWKWLGTGLLTSTNEKWKKHRKMLTPAFHFKMLEEFQEVFNTFGDILISKLDPNIGQHSIDIFPPITLCTLDIICASSMGTNVKAQENSNSEYVRSVKEMCRIVIERMATMKSIDFLYYFCPDYKSEKAALHLLHNFTNKVIAARKREIFERSAYDSKNDNDLGLKKKLTFLDMMLQYKAERNILSDDDIRQEVDTFMFEGHDTTSAGISFVLYCLANHPVEQQKVMDELTSIFDDNRKATYEDLTKMKYLEMAIKESLRLYPPVPIFGRNVPEDTGYDKYMLPKGLTLVVFVYGLHRDPKFYPDPERFDPERFTLENQSKRPACAYVPFSAGSRNCIGQKFAMLEMKSVVSKVLRHFELLPATPEHIPKLMGQLIMKSENGVCISMKRRLKC